MPEAARLGDQHSCWMHGGGPILPDCCPSVLIGDRPAARAGDKCKCWCAEDPIKEGAATVIIGDSPAARRGDPTDGGKIIEGCPTVIIGDPPQAACMLNAASVGAAFVTKAD
ncbi:PAAR domain-containing protein [Polyangium spumosum]|uniref:Type VI secretion protein n=1 Tax=Polyangium spumosum TaxID=889282 RepID=A0A6N7Q0U5_9BACT|nr:PAAR domain-containing protein [Polyangium spumosum]MRG96380.1 type VI secretion protein [Polyangium spumosum]